MIICELIGISLSYLYLGLEDAPAAPEAKVAAVAVGGNNHRLSCPRPTSTHPEAGLFCQAIPWKWS